MILVNARDAKCIAHAGHERGEGMDFIERIFGISPDGGSGSLELLLFLVPLFGISLFFVLRSRKR
jgi:hypothetical protein